MQALTFQNITLIPAKVDNQIWLSSADLAKALGYSQSNAITKLYNENSDEFSPCMTKIIDTMVGGINNSQRKIKIRIFSLRGCHLIAMFSRTKIAKAFRGWVLDILDKEVGEPKTTAHDRTPLRQAVSMLVGKRGIGYDVAYSLVHQYMGVAHIDEIAPSELPKAVAYVHYLLLDDGKKDNDGFTYHAQNLAWTALVITSWYKAIEPHFRALSPQLCGEIHDHMICANTFAGGIKQTIGLGQMADKLPLLETKKWAIGR